MGESNKREMEAFSSLEPGERQWSHTWPLEQDRQPELAGTLPSSCSWKFSVSGWAVLKED